MCTISRVLLLLLTLLLSLPACNGVFFYPSKEISLTPDQLSLKYEDTWFESEDGTLLHAWFLPAIGVAKGSVLFFHGNAQNISNHLASVYWLPERGYNVLMLDYRGYGRSEGTPSVEGAKADALAAFRAFRARPDVEGGPLVVFGQSLGAVFALELGTYPEVQEEVSLVIADSAFTRFRDIAEEKLEQFWLTSVLRWPLLWTITTENSALDSVSNISPVPLLLIHGADDEIVPPHHSKELFAAAREPKTLWLVPDTKHIQSLAREEYRDRLIEKLDQIIERARD